MLDDPIAEPKELKETEGIGDYHAKFELIRSRIRMSEEYLVSAYLAGLRLDTQMHIRMFHPRNTRECLVLGKLYEKAHPRKAYNSSWSANKSSGTNNAAKGLLPTPKVNEKTAGTNQQMCKFLTNEEMSARRAKGLCYYCDEKFSPEHALKHKKTQLFLMDVEESEPQQREDMEEDCYEGGEEDDIAQISLNAVTGVTDYTTMRVKGVHGMKNVFALVDSGSTHNFIDQNVPISWVVRLKMLVKQEFLWQMVRRYACVARYLNSNGNSKGINFAQI